VKQSGEKRDEDATRRHSRAGGIRRLLPSAAAMALVLAAVLAALTVLVWVSPALAASSFSGGADDYPLVVANDHTPVVIHLATTGSPTGLESSTSYNVKIRFCPAPTPGGGQQFGYTWNPASGAWAQERDSWTLFPEVKTDATGALQGWVVTKVGKTTPLTGGVTLNPWGPYYVVVSLSKVGASTGTLNGDLQAPVTLMDMTGANASYAGFWVHNGAATGASAGVSAEARGTSPTADLGRDATEPDLVDDDADGVVDDEDWGPSGSAGDFHLAVPLGRTFGILLGGFAWAPGQSVSGTTPDVDIALGASDQTPPSAPTGPTAAARNAGVALSWPAASDDVGVEGYDIYRWTATASSLQYTAPHVCVGHVTGTTFTDTGLTNGTTYSYEVRARDAATNASRRSDSASATPEGIPPTTTDDAPPAWITGRSRTITFTAVDQAGGSGVAATYFSVNGLPARTGGSVTVTTPFKRIHDRVITVTYWSVDLAGNVETPMSCQVKFDVLPPLTQLVSPLTPVFGPATVELNASDASSGVAGTWHRVDGGDWAAGTSFELADAGDRWVEFYSTDAVGNVEPVRGQTVTVLAAKAAARHTRTAAIMRSRAALRR
jgi:hypothetical protein